MTDIEKQALALVNEVSPYECHNIADTNRLTLIKSLCRAIEMLNAEREAHAATKRDMSDAVESAIEKCRYDGLTAHQLRRELDRFIIKPPVDPLVEVFNEIGWSTDSPRGFRPDRLRAALAARGGRIVFDGGE